MKYLKDIVCKVLDKPFGAIAVTTATGCAIRKIIKTCKKKQKVKPVKEETQVTAIIVEEKED